jgi:hypothetical protein
VDDQIGGLGLGEDRYERLGLVKERSIARISSLPCICGSASRPMVSQVEVIGTKRAPVSAIRSPNCAGAQYVTSWPRRTSSAMIPSVGLT